MNIYEATNCILLVAFFCYIKHVLKGGEIKWWLNRKSVRELKIYKIT